MGVEVEGSGSYCGGTTIWLDSWFSFHSLVLRILLARGMISAAVSSVEMPMRATMPGPILETSLPSTEVVSGMRVGQ